MDRQIRGAGTAEAEWLQCAALMALPLTRVASIVPEEARLVICAPHPDDEILPCGGLLVAAAEARHPIVIIAITDGEASHGADESTRVALQQMRPEETYRALYRLNVDAEIVRLAMPDGEITRCENQLSHTLNALFEPGDVVIAPWRLDGHPDHEATARAARTASAARGCTYWESPIWGWHWSHPSDSPLPWSKGIRLAVPEAVRARKREAIREFKSQLEVRDEKPAILSSATLERFDRTWEVFFR